MTKETTEEPVEVADDERPVIIHDELAECTIEDPTFGGMRAGAPLEEAYEKVVTKLREVYEDRFRNRPPADERLLFTELDEELVLPHARLIGELVVAVKERVAVAPDKVEAILAVVDDFLEKVSA